MARWGAALLALTLAAAAAADETTYSGGFLDRSTITGDWGGARNDLAAKGVTFNLSLTQVGQGVVDGGKDASWQYSGRGNLTTNLDTQKLGLWPGGFLTLELEGNYSKSVNGSTGSLMPVNSNQLYPEPVGDNFNVPQLSFAQFLSPYAGVMLGKLDTLSGDANEFAHGKGDTQFMNLALNLNPTLLVAVPYSTLGAGVIVLPTKDPHAAILNFMVLQGNGQASTPGFDDLDDDKLVFAGAGRVRTDFFGMTGHQLVGGAYANKQFASIDQRLGFVIENRALKKEDGAWAVYYNFDQYLYEPHKGAGRGAGLFFRFGASDGNPNPMQYFFSGGVGGNGMMASRPLDRFGLGFYYIDVKSPTFQRPFFTRTFLGDEWGFEAFYNVAITPWMLLTPDLQVVEPSQRERLISLGRREKVDTATVLALRLQLLF